MDAGQSAEPRTLGGGDPDEVWSTATKAIVPARVVTYAEPLVLEFVVRCPDTLDDEHNVGAAIRNTADTDWRFSTGLQFVGSTESYICRARVEGCYNVNGPYATLPVLLGDVVDMKLVATPWICEGYYRLHGAPDWIKFSVIESEDPGAGNLMEHVRLSFGNRGERSYVDSISLSIGDPVAPPATVTGQVVLGDYGGPSNWVFLDAELFDQSGQELVPRQHVDSKACTMSFTFAPDPAVTTDYLLVLKGTMSKAQTIPVTIIPPDSVDVGTISLLGGDADGDGSITTTDLSINIKNMD